MKCPIDLTNMKKRCTSNNYSQIFPKMIWMQHFFVIFVINLGKLYKIILQFDDFHSVLGPILLNKHSTVMNIPSFGSNYFPKFLHAQMKYKIRPNVISKNSGFSKNKYCCQCAPKQVIRFACFLGVRPIDLMILDSQIRRHIILTILPKFAWYAVLKKWIQCYPSSFWEQCQIASSSLLNTSHIWET